MQWMRMFLLLGLACCIIAIGCDSKDDPVSPDPPDPLEPLQPLGSLEVFSTPPGATIIFSGDTVGTTPDTLTDIPAGYYSLKLIMDRYYNYSNYVKIDSGQMTSIDATLRVMCTGQIIGDLSQPPEIDFIDLKAGNRTIYGVANNIDASQVRVVLWALTNIWYVQPLIASPYTNICDDGSWQNWTHGWKTMVAVLVDSTYVPGAVRYTHPGFEQGVLAFAQYPPVRPDLPIQFSDYTWGVKQSADRFDPGPNYWSASVDNIWVDGDGMHLHIYHDGTKWTCPEVYLLQ